MVLNRFLSEIEPLPAFRAVEDIKGLEREVVVGRVAAGVAGVFFTPEGLVTPERAVDG